MKRNILTNSELEEKFNEQGFVVIDLLNDEELDNLESIMKDLEASTDQDDVTINSEYKLSFFNRDPEYKMKILNTIYGYLKPYLDPVLDKYEPLIVNLFNKKPGGGEVPVHQNWSFVDESKYTSVSVWVPLCNVSHHNGTMEVVPNTHNTLTPFRSPSIPWVFQGLEDVVKQKYMQPLNLNRGQVAIIDDAILHYTSVNNSDTDRRTIQLIMKPAEAMAIHYYCKNIKNGSLDVYEVSPEFFASFNMNDVPQNVSVVEKLSFEFEPIKKEREFARRIQDKH